MSHKHDMVRDFVCAQWFCSICGVKVTDEEVENGRRFSSDSADKLVAIIATAKTLETNI